MKTWVCVDVPSLAYRAFYTTGQLENGTVYGFLKAVLDLIDRFAPDVFVFAFDSKVSKRKEYFPDYKKNRAKNERRLTDDKKEALARHREQVVKLGTEYLPAIGFRNVIRRKGYEADDVLAQVVMPAKEGGARPKDVGAVVVSGDHDLYQLLQYPDVHIYQPIKKRIVTHKEFYQEYLVNATDWGWVKAIAGCKSDNIPGVKGVAEKTAARFMSAKLKTGSLLAKEIAKHMDLIQSNIRLTRLPFDDGLKDLQVVEDETSPRSWMKLLTELGMDSIRS